MKASGFDYVRPASVAEAVALLARHGEQAKLVAGGQSLLPALNLRLSAPALLIDIGRLDELRGTRVTQGRLRIGAGCTHAALLADPMVALHAPLLQRALLHVAHPAIRTRGTFGGSLANADPAAELPACVLALDATLVLQGPAGQRRVLAGAFFRGLFETALAPDEVLVAAEIALSPGMPWGFAELSRRSGDYAIVGLAAHGAAAALRLAYFSVGTRPVLARAAAAALAAGVSAGTLQDAERALAGDLPEHADLQASASVRLHLARTLLRRVMRGWMALVEAAA